MRVLQIIEPAWRATLEEQDDTVLWFTRAIRAAGAHADVLLCGTAVCYAVRGQDADGFRVGGWAQQHPPAIEHEISKLMDSGARVAALAEDLADRGILTESILPNIEILSRKSLGGLCDQYDRIWKW
jgi:sulfur transfer complex TusBCD TusB component (DsrH family)